MMSEPWHGIFTIPITPFRALDTRATAGRANHRAKASRFHRQGIVGLEVGPGQTAFLNRQHGTIGLKHERGGKRPGQ